LKSALMPYF